MGGGALSLVAAFLAALALFYFINQVVGHVRFLPLLAGLVFLYAIGKELHLSPLIVVLVCGLIINNPQLVTWHAKLRGIQNDTYEQTLREFKSLVAELTFATKSFFFLLLGYWTDTTEMLSIEAWLVAIGGIAAILASRWLILKLLRQSNVAQLVWIAPRGLITVLLFLSARGDGKARGIPVRRCDAGGARDGGHDRDRASRQRTCRACCDTAARAARDSAGHAAAGALGSSHAAVDASPRIPRRAGACRALARGAARP